MTRPQLLEDALQTALERISVDINLYRASATVFGKNYATIREFAATLPMDKLRDDVRACINAFRTSPVLQHHVGIVAGRDDTELLARYAGYVISENYQLAPEQLWTAAFRPQYNPSNKAA